MQSKSFVLSTYVQSLWINWSLLITWEILFFCSFSPKENELHEHTPATSGGDVQCSFRLVFVQSSVKCVISLQMRIIMPPQMTTTIAVRRNKLPTIMKNQHQHTHSLVRMSNIRWICMEKPILSPVLRDIKNFYLVFPIFSQFSDKFDGKNIDVWMASLLLLLVHFFYQFP